MKYLFTFVTLFAILFSTGCSIKQISPAGMTVSVPASKITESLQREFPVKQKTAYGTVTLSDPKAFIQKGSDRLTAGATVQFSNPLIAEQKGSVYVSGKPRFDANSGNIYLDAPKIEKLDFNGYSLGAFVTPEIMRQVQPYIDMLFQRIPVYRLNRNTLRNSFVKDVKVADGNLLVTFGI